MSLTALAVVNRQGKPLYLRDFDNKNANGNKNLIFNFSSQLDNNDGNINNDDLFQDDIFTNYQEITSKQYSEWPCEIKYQFILHSANDRLEEILQQNSWRVPGATSTSGMEACWVGLICLSDNLRAYGYVTTNARYITLVEDSIAPENVQVQKSHDSEICVLMSNIHRFYTESLLNPFTTPHSKITSKRFDSNVTSLVHGFNVR